MASTSSTSMMTSNTLTTNSVNLESRSQPHSASTATSSMKKLHKRFFLTFGIPPPIHLILPRRLYYVKKAGRRDNCPHHQDSAALSHHHLSEGVDSYEKDKSVPGTQDMFSLKTTNRAVTNSRISRGIDSYDDDIPASKMKRGSALSLDDMIEPSLTSFSAPALTSEQTAKRPKIEKLNAFSSSNVISLVRDFRFLDDDSLQPCLSANSITQQNLKLYRLLSPGFEKISSVPWDEIVKVNFAYPSIGCMEEFPLLLPAKHLVHEYNPIHDMVISVQEIVKHYFPLIPGLFTTEKQTEVVRKVVKYSNRKDTQEFAVAIGEYNSCIDLIRKHDVLSKMESNGPAGPFGLVCHVLEQAYSRSVAPFSHQLNNYEGFSNNVYGEIKHIFVQDIIKNSNLQAHHTFLDMGSGIGNVVLHAAGQTLCDCYGVEIMEIPAQLAVKQKNEFMSRMHYYSLPCGRITLKHADFLDDPEIDRIIQKADVIFVNNYAFDAQLNQNIALKLLDLKEDAVVVSLRSFVPVTRTNGLRRINAVESIFTVEEKRFGKEYCSWMTSDGSYYVHTVNRRQLANKLSQLPTN